MTHIPVLLNEVISGLSIKPSDTFLDGTLNAGGHSKAASKILGTEGVIIGIDLDGNALTKAREALSGIQAKVFLVQENFGNMELVLSQVGIKFVDKILLDLGLSSNQLEESGRGFSFNKKEPLQMTFKENPGPSDLTAGDIVNRWDEENIAQIIKSYGEERFAEKIAHAIVFEREKQEIKTTEDLVNIIKIAIPKKYQSGKINPATKTFQALRITVNDEITNLKKGLEQGFEHLNISGRIAVISFHSLEDRMVKNFFKQKAIDGRGIIITKKPIIASKEEEDSNPRSRSAKLRILEKIA
jgi:16S rRNA (cytosine1402-N4)-methyltransferase